ncbi:MAG: beta-propeller fold lactonase family protein [Bacteroidota bacterium]
MKRKNQLAGIIAAALILTFSACKKENNFTNPGTSTTASGDDMISERGQNPDEEILSASGENERHSNNGFVYTESNDVAHNSILCYKQHADGHLSYESTTMSGGAGNGAGLGSQGAVVLDEHHAWLYAVNAGDNSVSSFEVHSDGSLMLAHTTSSGGTTPVSVTTHHNLLYVVNAGSDNIKGLQIGAGGSLTDIAGSMQSLSITGAGAAQISFSPNGYYLYVTEKATNMITTFHVNGSGVAGAGASMASVGQTPFGFEFARGFMVVSNAAGGAAGAGSATSYSGTNSGNLNDVNGAIANNQAAPCWVAVTHHGRFAFTTNTATDNISSYYVAPSGGLYLIHSAIPSGDAPIDMVIAGNNYYAYTLCAADHTIREYNRTFLGGLNLNGSISNLPDHAAGLAAY